MQTYPLLFVETSKEEFIDILSREGLKRISYPKKHSLKETWCLRMDFSGNSTLEINSETFLAAGWSEVNCISVKKIKNPKDGFMGLEENIASIDFDGSFIKKITKLIYQEALVFFDCGMILRVDNIGDLYICGGVISGTVSVKFPSSENFGDFFPEIDLEDCCAMEILWTKKEGGDD